MTTSGNSYTYVVTFNSGTASINPGGFQVNTAGLTPTLIPTITMTTGSGSGIETLGTSGTNSSKKITLDNSVTSFAVTYDSQTTATVANNTASPSTTASAIQAALGD